jgi:hypothetical protein
MIIGRISDTYQLPHPFREPLQFTVMSVMGVTSLYPGVCMTILMPVYLRASYHRHVHLIE